MITRTILKIVLKRLSEASTWRGIILSIGGVYTFNNPELVEAIVPICLALVGLIGAMMPDQNKTIEHMGDTHQEKQEYTEDKRDERITQIKRDIIYDDKHGGYNG